MRYTIPEGPNAGKRINVPDEVLERTMRSLDVDRAQAVQIYLEDEGYLENEVVKEYTEAAKVNKTVNHDAGTKPKRKAPVRKPDEIKRAIVAALAEFLGEVDNMGTVEVTNVERMIAFDYAGEKYELTLTKKRKPKE